MEEWPRKVDMQAGVEDRKGPGPSYTALGHSNLAKQLNNVYNFVAS